MIPSIDLLHEFGGTGPVVHLAHANGFPPGAYGPLAGTLADRFRVIGLPARPLWPGSQPESIQGWHPFTDDLIQGLDALGLRGVCGIGHSMGGVFTLRAAVQRPDLFRALALIDPVILPPSWLLAVRLMHAWKLERYQPFVQGALRRRRTWPSRQACYEHFRGKQLFRKWPESGLRAYVQAATRQRADGTFELIYPPEWEARIFATTPTDIWRDVARLKLPVLFVRGERTNVFRPEFQEHIARMLPGAQFAVIPGAGHLVPLERPAETGRAVGEFFTFLPNSLLV